MRFTLLLCLLLFGVGCASSKLAPPPKGGKKEARGEKEKGGEPDVDEGRAKEPGRAGRKGAKPAPRKIIYTAEVEVIVDEFEDAEEKLLHLLEERDGYIAKSEVQGTPGVARLGVWTLRVPAEKFAPFLKAVGRLGELRRDSLDSQDVTDSYYDLKADVRNLEAREEALRKLYVEKIAGSKLEDLLAVDRELAQVRGRINKARGQIQRWDKETAFSTAVVTLRDRKDYVSPIVPDYGTRLGRAFQASVEGLVEAGKFLVLAFVVLAPWVLVLGLLAAPVWVVARRRQRRAPPAPPRSGP
jgi:hypothetical protein